LNLGRIEPQSRILFGFVADWGKDCSSGLSGFGKGLGGIMGGRQLNHGRWQFVGLDAVALDLVAEQICQLEEKFA
jgi:hypothetical protein